MTRKITKVARYFVSLNAEQEAVLRVLMQESLATTGEESSFFASLLLEARNSRETIKNMRIGGSAGRPKKYDPAEDPTRPKTLRNPCISDPKDPNYLVNEFELALINAENKK